MLLYIYVIIYIYTYHIVILYIIYIYILYVLGTCRKSWGPVLVDLEELTKHMNLTTEPSNARLIQSVATFFLRNPIQRIWSDVLAAGPNLPNCTCIYLYIIYTYMFTQFYRYLHKRSKRDDSPYYDDRLREIRVRSWSNLPWRPMTAGTSWLEMG
jgi:hypothetical protein